MICNYKILPGLPPYGAMAESFPTGQMLAQEGLVVCFDTPIGSWVVNFKKGGSEVDKVFMHPDEHRLIVCAGGVLYFVEPEKRLISWQDDLHVSCAYQSLKHNLIIFGDVFRFYAIGKHGVVWKTNNQHWDGFRNIHFFEDKLTGEAFSPYEGTWNNFEINIQTGFCIED